MAVSISLFALSLTWGLLPPEKAVQSVAGRDSASQTTLHVLSSVGADPFRLVTQRLHRTGFITNGDAMYFRSLDVGADGKAVYGVSWDELYLIGPQSGDYELLGKLRAPNTFRAWFNRSSVYEDVALSGPTTVDWVLRATLESPDAGSPGFVAEIDERGTKVITASSGSVGFTNLLYWDFPLESGVLVVLQINWGWSPTFSPLAFININANAEIPLGTEFSLYALGMFGAESDAFDVGADDASLPLAGISLAPDGRLIGLSDGDWDVHGGSGLYELFVESNGVLATHLSQPEVRLTSIEFLDDGTLIGAGDSLYEIDLLTGDAIEIGTTGIDPIADLDAAPDGELYGVTLPSESDSQLIVLTPDAAPQAPVTLQPPGRHWGLAVRERVQFPEPAQPISR